jgi:c-di-GMP-binding flagellar brake protein YcgR
MSEQRRNFFRVFVSLPVTVWRLDDGSADEPFTAETQDLSAGGALLRSREPLEEGSMLRLGLVSDEPELDVEVTATVLRVWEDEHGRTLSAMKFGPVTEPVESSILRYCNAAERLFMERRLAVRMTVELPVRIEIGERRVDGFTVEVSSDSALIIAPAAVAVGDQVEITLGGDAQTRVSAEVDSVREGEFVVSYPDAARKTQAAIVRAVFTEERRLAHRSSSEA